MDISLTSGIGSTLTSLQRTQELQSATQSRIATGKQVNSFTDNPVNFSIASNLLGRADALTQTKDTLSQATQTLNASLNGSSAISALLSTAQGLVEAARSASPADRTQFSNQFSEVLKQVNSLAKDSGYNGTNLLQSGSLNVSLNESGSSSLTLQGADSSATGLGVSSSTDNFQSNANLDVTAKQLQAAQAMIATNQTQFSSQMSVLAARQDFTANLVNTLKQGADNLTLANMNEEAANMLALNTRQQLGTTSLKLASQNSQSALKLFP
jgi:flagellin